MSKKTAAPSPDDDAERIAALVVEKLTQHGYLPRVIYLPPSPHPVYPALPMYPVITWSSTGTGTGFGPRVGFTRLM